MKSGALVFLAAFFALAGSWFGFVIAPQAQIGRSGEATNAVGSGDLCPPARPGLARQGAEVYRANGCVYCHSQQVGQEATRCDVVLTSVGTNKTAILALLAKLGAGGDPKQMETFVAGLPRTIAEVPGMDAAGPILDDFGKAGARVEAHVIPLGPDIARGWGRRRTVAQDYLFDYPVQPGSRRIGPDLANVGVRLPDASWHLRHLYAPQNEVKGSTMPPYRFFFETRKIGRQGSPDALQLPANLAPAPGFEIVPKPEAEALVAYLMSLRADAPLFEAPWTPPPPPAGAAPTNAPAAAPSTK